ncbi:MAG: tail fiber domain-containing protein [Verrucomicrobiales bacterium]|nr:tail fiber domain-containing protein [Verrucomicrobiales bacterium]
MKSTTFASLCCLAVVASTSELQAQLHQAANGNIGIGSANPTAKLEVFNTTGNSSDTAIFFAPKYGPRYSHVHFGATGDWYIRSASDAGKVILQDLGGRVGIGTSSPAGKLHVADWHTDVRTSEQASPDGWARDGLTVMGNPGVGFSSFRVRSGHNPVADRGLVSFDRNDQSYFYVRMDGNVGVGTKVPGARLDVVGGVRCTTLELTSDKAAKSEFRAVDSNEVLDKVSRLPISTWSYRDNSRVRHVGPMAQDFKAAFDVGSDDGRHISVVDGIGVSLAAIQGLHAQLRDSQSRVADQDQEIAQLKADLGDLRQILAERLAALERSIPVPASERLTASTATNDASVQP